MANVITVSRLLPLTVVVILLYLHGPAFQLAAVPLILILLLMDLLDGIVARRLGQVSKLGSALDIAMDRLVEFVMWVCTTAVPSKPPTSPPCASNTPPAPEPPEIVS